MAAAKPKSPKRSATNGGGRARPRKSETFFVDECLGRRAVPDALRAAGHHVTLLSQWFAPDVDDEVWLSELHAHRRRLIVLTKDTRIRKRSLERMAFIASGVRVFALTAGDLDGAAQAAAFVKALPRIIRIARQPGPFIAVVTGSGHVKILEQPRVSRKIKKHHRSAR